jgi:hypothetical protein
MRKQGYAAQYSYGKPCPLILLTTATKMGYQVYGQLGNNGAASRQAVNTFDALWRVQSGSPSDCILPFF